MWKKKDIDLNEYSCEERFVDKKINTLYEYSKLFIDKDILGNIVQEISLYAILSNINNPFITDKLDLRKYMGINFLVSVIKLPQYRMYWTNTTKYSKIADEMSRNQFENIKRYLHINNNTEAKRRSEPGYDPLFKVRPFIEKLRGNFKSISSEETNSVHEVLIPTKCRNFLKQYIKNKPHKWDVKMFTRCSVSGIIYDFEV